MYICEVCDKKFTSKIGLHTHVCKCKDSLHYSWWLNHLKCLINDSRIDVIAYKKENGEKLIQIYNHECKHKVWINYYNIIRQHQLCNHKECVSKTKREIMNSLKNTELYKSNVSKAVKQALKDPIKRMNRLKGQAQHQRNLNSPYELMFIGILTKYNIKYTYQIPMIIQNEGCIIDFYLDDYKMYVNINCDIFHWLPDEDVTPKLKKSVQERKNKDKIIRDIFKKEHIKFIEVYTFEDMENLVNELIRR